MNLKQRVDKMNIFLTGATGILGSHIIPYLLRKNYSLIALKHRKEPQEIDGVKWVYADLTCQDRLQSLLEKIDCVIHLAAVTHSNNIQEYFAGNELATLNLVRASEAKEIKHFIFISTRAIDPSGGAYAKSKYVAENIVQNSKLNWTILRPAEVYGIDSNDFITQIIRMLRKNNFVFIPGDGSTKVAPLFIDDLLDFILQVILDNKSYKKIYTLTGPIEYTLSDFTDCVALYLGAKRKPFKARIPLRLLSIFLELNAKLNLSNRLCRDQIERLMVKKDSDFTLARSDFNFNPRHLREAIKLIGNKLK